MQRILLFGGTTEGRMLAAFCEEKQIPVTVCVTTDYGAQLLQQSKLTRQSKLLQQPESVQVLIGKKNRQEIGKLLAQTAPHEQYTMVIDATHPYAVEASANIQAACAEQKLPCYRVIRPSLENASNGIYFETLAALIAYINTTIPVEERLLITTGSKELSALCAVKNYQNRCVTRFLPNESIAKQCLEMGYRKELMIMEKGPFSVEQNCAHIRAFGAGCLVTKDSGAAGGFPEKIEAAKLCGIKALIVRRPKETGYTMEQIQRLLEA